MNIHEVAVCGVRGAAGGAGGGRGAAGGRGAPPPPNIVRLHHVSHTLPHRWPPSSDSASPMKVVPQPFILNSVYLHTMGSSRFSQSKLAKSSDRRE